MSKVALIIIDMLNDFVTGALKCERANRIVPNISKLINRAREKKIPIIYVNDAHLPKIDFEFVLWGPHAIKGTKGAEVISGLKPREIDIVVEKRRYSGFYSTDLDDILKELNVNTLILTGLHTNCCVKHTAGDAFFRGYKVVVPEDCVEAFTEEDHRWGLEYMRKFYNAEITTCEEVLRRYLG